MSDSRATASSRKKPWGGQIPSPADAIERLLDVAESCLEDSGLDAFGIKAVALRANVGRPTVYRYFENREALLIATLIRRGERQAETQREKIRDLPSAAEMALLIVFDSLDYLTSDPILNHRSADPETEFSIDPRIMALWTHRDIGKYSLDWGRPLIEKAGWTDPEAYECIETMTRFVHSIALFPRPQRNPARLRDYLIRRMLPAIGLALPDENPNP